MSAPSRQECLSNEADTSREPVTPRLLEADVMCLLGEIEALVNEVAQ